MTDVPMIEADHLTKVFGTFRAIEDVTFSVGRGEVVAFLGPNGAGKSTTMRILTGYLSPTQGRARIAGIDVQENRLEAVRRLGYLPENGPLYLEMTPRETLEFFGRARGLESEALEKRIAEVAGLCAIEAVLDKPTQKLSKGFRQRVGMAHVLLHDPDVLIMDEPTSGLDPNQILQVRETIRRLGETKTILLSTHILQEVEAVASRVILIHAGRVVFDGSRDELCARGDGDLDRAFHVLTGAA